MKETLKALREHFNYSQNSLAKFLGISRQMYIKYENGEVEPPVKIVSALAGLYKVPYEVLIENKFSGGYFKGFIKEQSKEHSKEKNEVEYKFAEDEGMKLCDSGAEVSVSQMYQDNIVKMFLKLSYLQQVKVFAELAGEIQRHGEEVAESILETKRERDPLQDFFELGDKLHGNSNGWKWNREELYDREICRHRGE